MVRGLLNRHFFPQVLRVIFAFLECTEETLGPLMSSNSTPIGNNSACLTGMLRMPVNHVRSLRAPTKRGIAMKHLAWITAVLLVAGTMAFAQSSSSGQSAGDQSSMGSSTGQSSGSQSSMGSNSGQTTDQSSSTTTTTQTTTHKHHKGKKHKKSNEQSGNSEMSPSSGSGASGNAGTSSGSGSSSGTSQTPPQQ